MPGPLAGRRVVVTRAREQAGRLAGRLAALGATVIEVPVTRFTAPADWTALDRACDAWDSFAWVAFTSANAVRFTLERWRDRGCQGGVLRGPRCAVVGAVTAAALKDGSLAADLVASRADAEGLAAALIAAQPEPTTLLLPQADNARTTLCDQLVAAGWRVTPVTAYRAEPIVVDPSLLAGGADAVTFASAATVQRFVAGMGPGLQALVAGGCRFYAIGPQTASALTASGLACAGIAEEASIEALVALVVRDCG